MILLAVYFDFLTAENQYYQYHTVIFVDSCQRRKIKRKIGLNNLLEL